MKCMKGTDNVCYYYEKCNMAKDCENVPKGIRKKLSRTKKDEVGKGYAKLKK